MYMQEHYLVETLLLTPFIREYRNGPHKWELHWILKQALEPVSDELDFNKVHT